MRDCGANISSALQNFEDCVALPCAGHKLNSCVNDLFKERVVKQNLINNLIVYSVKQFEEDGTLKTKVIDKKEYEDILLTNESKAFVNKELAACRHLVGSFHHSEPLQLKLKTLQADCKQKIRIKLVQDCKTRWNYTHDMIESILINQQPLKIMNEIDHTALTVPENF